MEKIKSFTDLIAWKESHKLVIMIYKLTKNFPKEEIFGLMNQMRRASVSISSNIAEGFSKNSFIEKNRFYSMARGSTLELQNQLLITRDIGYISNNEFKKVAHQTISAHKLINGLTRNSQDKPKYQILNTKY